MDEAATPNNARLFAAHAGNDIAVWKTVEGQQITHIKYGTGTIVEAKLNAEPSSKVHLLVRFPKDGEKKFKGEDLAEARWWLDMQLPSDVLGLEQTRKRMEEEQRHREELRKQENKRRQELKEQRKKERESAEEFARLKEKYGVQVYPYDSPTDPLYLILLQIDEGESLDKKQLSWLKKYRLNETLAIYKERDYSRSRNGWRLIEASSYWRAARRPEKALKATDRLLEEHFASGPPRFRSAILTTRGGALRDLGDLDAAERCAREGADQDQSSYHPHNLLGRILWQRGKAEEGDKCFARAAEWVCPVSTDHLPLSHSTSSQFNLFIL